MTSNSEMGSKFTVTYSTQIHQVGEIEEIERLYYRLYCRQSKINFPGHLMPVKKKNHKNEICVNIQQGSYSVTVSGLVTVYDQKELPH